MKNLKKTLFTFLLFSLTTEAFSAVTRAQAFSRANCHEPVSFNESISYDLLTGIHKEMLVRTIQNSTCGKYRELPGYNSAGFRVRAGFVDLVDSTVWAVKGVHQELLDNGTISRATTSATDCNLELDQWY